MKKDPNLPIGQNDDDQDITDRIRSSLADFDDSIPVKAPPLSFFNEYIGAERERTKKKWRKELLAFAFMAIVILSFMLMALFVQPAVYLTIQAMAVIFAGGYAVYVKRNAEVRHE